MSMLGKTFVVTSGASGIGLAIVHKLVQMHSTPSLKGLKLHGLVNCAGIVRQHPATVENDAIFKQVLDINLGGTWNLTTEFMRVVNAEDATAKKPDTSIVNIGSTSSYRGFPFIPGYVASKHAVLGLTTAMKF
ncbi:hypothetical protein LRP88_11352 [Fusarium phalaenopsidis]|nr:hypothetical protein NCS56_01454900 [Fusarium sp. Ph1]